MVKLDKIYTKGGDGGETSLGGGDRVAKDHPRLAAIGSAEEANAILGIVRIHLDDEAGWQADAMAGRIQNDLFDLGADLCRPLAQEEEPGEVLRVKAEQVRRLEAEIDQINQRLEPLRSFVLPGGSSGASWLHLGRTICRRAERCVWSLAQKNQVNDQVLIYLNRLSDLLFVVARAENDGGVRDVLWEPGKTQDSGTT